MTVHFIGAGPGAADLITVRGRDLIASSPVCLYAGALVPVELLDHCPPGAHKVDTANLDLDEILAELTKAHEAGQDVARLHSGDPSVFSAMAEQMRRLDALDIPYDVTPGVPAYAAAAASLRRELTVPEVGQTVILTRIAARATAMPPGEDLATLGASRGTHRPPPGGPAHRALSRRISPELWLRLPRSSSRPRLPQRRAHPPRHPRDHRPPGPRGRHPPHRGSHRRPSPCRRQLPRLPPLLNHPRPLSR